MLANSVGSTNWNSFLSCWQGNLSEHSLNKSWGELWEYKLWGEYSLVSIVILYLHLKVRTRWFRLNSVFFGPNLMLWPLRFLILKCFSYVKVWVPLFFVCIQLNVALFQALVKDHLFLMSLFFATEWNKKRSKSLKDFWTNLKYVSPLLLNLNLKKTNHNGKFLISAKLFRYIVSSSDCIMAWWWHHVSFCCDLFFFYLLLDKFETNDAMKRHHRNLKWYLSIFE